MLLVDVINAFDFPNARALVEAAEAAAPRIASLCDQARSAGAPTIYVNDNFGRWRSDFRATHVHSPCERRATRQSYALPSREGLLRPETDALRVLCFGARSIARAFENQTLVMAGFATDLCMLFTAHDAYMRKYELFVPNDLTAANTRELAEHALAHMRHALGARIDPSDTVLFE